MSAIFDNDELVPSHFGNPFAEEQGLRAGRAFSLLDWDVVRVAGADCARLLHVISSRDFERVAPGTSTEMLVLDANGHVAHAAGAVVVDDAIWLLTDRGLGQALVDHIVKMRFMMRVEADVVDAVAVGALVDVPGSVCDVALAVWQDPWPVTAPGGAHYGVADEDHPAFGRTCFVAIAPRDAQDSVVSAFKAAGFAPAGKIAWEAARVADWRPSFSHEGAQGVLPHEVDWLRTAVHTAKGCYPGQETVAKLVNLGKPPRRLAFLYLEGGEELPPVGCEVTLDSRVAGVVTSVARSADDGPIALALLKRNVPADAVVTVGDFVASQVEIVKREGKSSISPEVRPGTGLNSRRLGGPAPAMSSKSLGGK